MAFKIINISSSLSWQLKVRQLSAVFFVVVQVQVAEKRQLSIHSPKINQNLQPNRLQYFLLLENLECVWWQNGQKCKKDKDEVWTIACKNTRTHCPGTMDFPILLANVVILFSSIKEKMSGNAGHL